MQDRVETGAGSSDHSRGLTPEQHSGRRPSSSCDLHQRDPERGRHGCRKIKVVVT
jgi:hypothetical protein